MRFAPQPLVSPHAMCRCATLAPRRAARASPSKSKGADGDGDDNGGDGGVDDGDQAFTVTALTDDGTALAERVPSANFNMQKTGPIWRGDRKENL
jgi:hypothetical protein